VVAAFLPWTPILIQQLASGGTAWAEGYFDLWAPIRSLMAFLPGGLLPPYVALEVSPRLSPFALLLALVLFAAAISLLISSRDTRRPVSALLCFAAVPLVLAYVISFRGPTLYLPARPDIVSYPALAITLGAAISAIRSRVARSVIAAASLVLAAPVLASHYASDQRAGDRAIAEAVARNLGTADDVVICTGLTFAPVSYYLARLAPRVRVLPFPREMASHPGNLDPNQTLDLRERDLVELERELRAVLQETRGSHLWVVVGAGPLGVRLTRYLAGVAWLEPAHAVAGLRMGALRTPVVLRGYRVAQP
jgi:hypothetical protein